MPAVSIKGLRVAPAANPIQTQGCYMFSGAVENVPPMHDLCGNLWTRVINQLQYLWVSKTPPISTMPGVHHDGQWNLPRDTSLGWAASNHVPIIKRPAHCRCTGASNSGNFSPPPGGHHVVVKEYHIARLHLHWNDLAHDHLSVSPSNSQWVVEKPRPWLHWLLAKEYFRRIHLPRSSAPGSVRTSQRRETNWNGDEGVRPRPGI